MITAATYAAVIRKVGIEMEFGQRKTGTTTMLTKAGLSTPKADTEIVRSYGVGVKIITIIAADLPGITPERFDTLVINGVERLSIDHVLPSHEPGTGVVIGWRCIVKGK